MYSPGVMVAAVPTTVTRSRWPRTLTRRTQKPVSSLWNVTRSTAPVRCSMGLTSGEVGAKGAIDCSRAYRWGTSRSHCGRYTQRRHMFGIPGRTCTWRAYYTPEQCTRVLTIQAVGRPLTGTDGACGASDDHLSAGRRSRSCFHIQPRKPWIGGYIGDSWRKPVELVKKSPRV